MSGAGLEPLTKIRGCSGPGHLLRPRAADDLVQCELRVGTRERLRAARGDQHIPGREQPSPLEIAQLAQLPLRPRVSSDRCAERCGVGLSFGPCRHRLRQLTHADAVVDRGGSQRQAQHIAEGKRRDHRREFRVGCHLADDVEELGVRLAVAADQQCIEPTERSAQQGREQRRCSIGEFPNQTVGNVLDPLQSLRLDRDRKHSGRADELPWGAIAEEPHNAAPARSPTHSDRLRRVIGRAELTQPMIS